MLTDMTDKIKVIAEYDGWYNHTSNSYPEHKYMRHPSRGMLIVGTINTSYLTDLNTLHPVAMRVLEDLETEFTKTNKYDAIKVIMPAQIVIKHACHTKPNESRQYVTLVDAVYKGIILLNELKTKEHDSRS